MLIQAEASNQLWQRFNDWGNSFLDALPDIIAAIVVFTIIYFLARFIKRIVAKAFFRHSENPAIATVMASFISIIIIIIGIFISLSILGLNQTVTSLLAGAGILGLVLGLALQDTLASAIAGVVMTMRKSYKVGDFVESNGFLGTITEVNLRNTTIRQTTGVEVKIPNKLVLNNPLINYSLTGERRIDIELGVGYDEDLEKIEQIIKSAFSTGVDFNAKKELEVYFTSLAASSITVLIRFWISKFRQADFLEAQSQAIKSVIKAFEREGIKIPFPVHVVEIKGDIRKE